MSNAIKMKVIEQLDKLPESLQQQVLVFMERLRSMADRGISGRELLRFAGSIPIEDLEQIRQAIEDGCEQVDVNEW